MQVWCTLHYLGMWCSLPCAQEKEKEGVTRSCFNYCRIPVEGKLKLKDNNCNPALWLKKKLIGG